MILREEYKHKDQYSISFIVWSSCLNYSEIYLNVFSLTVEFKGIPDEWRFLYEDSR